MFVFVVLVPFSFFFQFSFFVLQDRVLIFDRPQSKLVGANIRFSNELLTMDFFLLFRHSVFFSTLRSTGTRGRRTPTTPSASTRLAGVRFACLCMLHEKCIVWRLCHL
jgi:hypothetical protein